VRNLPHLATSPKNKYPTSPFTAAADSRKSFARAFGFVVYTRPFASISTRASHRSPAFILSLADSRGYWPARLCKREGVSLPGTRNPACSRVRMYERTWLRFQRVAAVQIRNPEFRTPHSSFRISSGPCTLHLGRCTFRIRHFAFRNLRSLPASSRPSAPAMCHSAFRTSHSAFLMDFAPCVVG
jgi:hypothetical protein